MNKADQPEPWLRGTLTDVAPVQRAVLHALELAREDLEKWCDGLTDDEINFRPAGIAPVAFHLRHIARSTDRLLTYAEGGQLSQEQINLMKGELDPGAMKNELLAELVVGFMKSARRIRHFKEEELGQKRSVGKKQLPTTVGGQAITTAKVVMAQRRG
jgi:hypothetical protein